MFWNLILLICVFSTGIFTNLLYQNKTIVYKLYKSGIGKGVCTSKNLKEFCFIILMLFKTGWQLLLQQSFFKNVNEISPNIYEINCVMKGKMHIFRFKVDAGPGKILQISDDNMIDITHQIEPYLNAEVVEIMKVTPHNFNQKIIYIEKFDGDNVTIKENEYITIKEKSN